MKDQTPPTPVQEDYARDGVVLLRNVLSPDWLEKLRHAVDEEIKRGERYFAYKNMRETPGTFQDYCLSSDIGRRGYAIRFAVAGATYEPRDSVTEWLHDDSLTAGQSFRGGRFPVIFEA